MTSLGERLKAINQQTEDERLAKQMRDRAAADAKAAADIKTVRSFFNAARSYIEHAIETGNAPKPFRLGIRGQHYDAASLLQTYRWPSNTVDATSIRANSFWPALYIPLWLEFETWLKENGLTASFQYAHDGVGIESWYELEVKAL